MIYFDQIMHHSAGNDQFAFKTFLLAPDTDQSTFNTGRAHYGKSIICSMFFSLLLLLIKLCHTFEELKWNQCKMQQIWWAVFINVKSMHVRMLKFDFVCILLLRVRH